MSENGPHRSLDTRSVHSRLAAAFGSPTAMWTTLTLALVCALFVVSQHPVPSDDAYITFRHVRNLLEHGRPAWNLSGPPVLGSTTPGFLFALAFFCKVSGLSEIPVGALYLNAVFHFLVVVLTYLVASDLIASTGKGILLSALVGLNGVGVYVASAGFESTMFTALLLAALWSVYQSHDKVAVLLASFSALVRPEGLLVLLLVWGCVLWRRRFRLGLLALSSIIPILWTLSATAYYGSPIPNSIEAKKKFPAVYQPYVDEEVSLLRRLPGLPFHALSLARSPAGPLVVSGRAAPEFTNTLQDMSRVIMLLGIPLTLITFAVNRTGALYALYPPMFLLFFGLIGHTQGWYFPSFVILSVIVLFVGWVRAIELLASALRGLGATRSAHYTTVSLCGVVLAAFLSVNQYRINRGEFDHIHRGLVFPLNPWGPLWNLWEVQRFTHYRTVAEYLNANAAPSSTVLASEVGVLGYFYRGKVIDAVGLCSPEVLSFYPPPPSDIFDEQGHYLTQTHNFIPTPMVEALRPDYLVNSRAYIRNLLRPGSDFLSQYELVMQFGRVWGEPVTIYRRRGIQ